MAVGIYYFYHGFGLKAFEGRHIRIDYILSGSLQASFSWLSQPSNTASFLRHSSIKMPRNS